MTTNRFWQLNKRPEGDDVASALSLESEEMPELAEGQVLVKAAYLSMRCRHPHVDDGAGGQLSAAA